MIFTLDDIRQFLFEKNYPEWTMQVVDRKTDEERLATMKDFDYSGLSSSTTLVFTTRFGGTITKKMQITDFKFITYDDISNILESGSTTQIDDIFSKDWINFLLFKHKNEYAKVVFDWSTRKISKIQKETTEKIQQFTQKETEKSKKKIDKYNKIAENAMKYLSDEDILDTIEDVNEY